MNATKKRLIHGEEIEVRKMYSSILCYRHKGFAGIENIPFELQISALQVVIIRFLQYMTAVG